MGQLKVTWRDLYGWVYAEAHIMGWAIHAPTDADTRNVTGSPDLVLFRGPDVALVWVRPTDADTPRDALTKAQQEWWDRATEATEANPTVHRWVFTPGAVLTARKLLERHPS